MTFSSLPGRNLGSYHILEPLGKGGMARVFRAYHPGLDRYVAVKVLRTDLIDDELFLERFRREARSVANLRHPNIIQVYDFQIQEEFYFMVMELMEGDTLKKRLVESRIRGTTLPPGEITRAMLDILDGLEYAHQAGVIHRDIKPGNILLTRRGEAVLGDFGIAHMIGGTRHTASGALMGTLNYMAPEQGLEGICDERSDIYSLGVVLYEMLTGQPPFEGDTPLAVLMKQVNDPLPLPREAAPAVPSPYEEVVLKALAKSPGERWQSARDMKNALLEAAAHSGVEIADRISLPLTFTTLEAPSESVAVFSGEARKAITDINFAGGDTDMTLGEQPANDSDAKPGLELLRALSRLGGLAVGTAASALNEVVDTLTNIVQNSSNPSSATQEISPPRESETSPAVDKKWTLLKALISLLLANTILLIAASLTGLWDIYRTTWPIELFLAAGIFSALMVVTESIWHGIPLGIIAGNGLIFLYCSLTGLWEHWRFLWIFEIWLIFGVLWWVITRSKRGTDLHPLSVKIGNASGVALTLLSFSALGLGVLVAAAARAITLFK